MPEPIGKSSLVMPRRLFVEVHKLHLLGVGSGNDRGFFDLPMTIRSIFFGAELLQHIATVIRFVYEFFFMLFAVVSVFFGGWRSNRADLSKSNTS